MFAECNSLKEIDLMPFKNSTGIMFANGMFKNCKSLKNLEFPFFASYNLANLVEMFYGCESLENLNLTYFSTINVYNITKMFYGCSSLKLLDIRRFDTRNILTGDAFKDLFEGIEDSDLFTIIYNKDSTEEISKSMKNNWLKILVIY